MWPSSDVSLMRSKLSPWKVPGLRDDGMPCLIGNYGKNKMGMLDLTPPFIFCLGASMPTETTSVQLLSSKPSVVQRGVGRLSVRGSSHYFGVTYPKHKGFKQTFYFAHRFCGSGIQVETQQKGPISAP